MIITSSLGPTDTIPSPKYCAWTVLTVFYRSSAPVLRSAC